MAETQEKSITQAMTKSLKQMLSEDNAYMVSILKKMKSTTYVQPGDNAPNRKERGHSGEFERLGNEFRGGGVVDVLVYDFRDGV